MNEIYKELEELEREQKELLSKIVELRGSIESVLPQRKNDLLECYQLRDENDFTTINLFDTFNIRYELLKYYRLIMYMINENICWDIYAFAIDEFSTFLFTGHFMTLIINHSTKEIIIVEVD